MLTTQQKTDQWLRSMRGKWVALLAGEPVVGASTRRVLDLRLRGSHPDTIAYVRRDGELVDVEHPSPGGLA